MMSISLIRGSTQHGMQHAYLNNVLHFCHFFQSFQLISVKMHNRMSSDQSKRRKISISTKIAIVEFLQTPGSSLNKAMEKFQVSRGTVQRAKRQTSELMYQKENNKNTKLTRLHHETPLNTLVFRWFCLARSQGFPISGPIMQEKAKQLALLLGVENFQASIGWLQSFKKRNSITLRTISGESGNNYVNCNIN